MERIQLKRCDVFLAYTEARMNDKKVKHSISDYNKDEDRIRQEGQHPLTGQRAANSRLLANQWSVRRLVTQWRHGCCTMRWSVCNAGASNWGRSLSCRYQGNGATPCQYIDTTLKTIHCTTTLPLTVFTVRRSYASAVLGVVILSVCLSVRHTCALWLIQRTYRWYFYTIWKGNPSSFLMPKISAKFQWDHPQRGREIDVG